MIQKIIHTPKISFALPLLFFVFVFFPQITEAATAYTWVGPSGVAGNGNWTDTTAWSPNGTPGSATGDSVTITNGYTVTISAAPTNSLASTTIAGGAATSGLKMTGTVWTYTSTNIDINASGTIIVDEDNTQGNLITVSATTLTVVSGGTINANSTGFPATQGPGFVNGNGGSYGGRGGGSTSAAAYGSSTAPTDLGSGSDGAAGGGAIRLDISGTLTNNGTISAKGQNSPNNSSEGASGGSIYVTAGILTGSGIFSADGGYAKWGSVAGNSGGGGGRISLQVTTTDSFTGSVTADGGNSYPDATLSFGEIGTVKRNKFEDGSLSPNITASTTWIGQSTFSFSSLTIQSDLTVNRYGGDFGASALNTANPSLILNITNSLTVGSAATGTIIGNVNITVPTLTVNSGSQIKAYATGFPHAQGPGFVNGNGASYGGRGGGSTSAAAYGSSTAPTDLGSGSDGVAGGGAIRLDISGTLTNNGTISANGQNSASNSDEAASGGSIYVTAGILTGSGIFSADGGYAKWGSVAGNSGGGGGRISLQVTTTDSFTGSVTADGGNSYPDPGATLSFGEIGTVKRNKFEDGSLSPNITASTTWIGQSTFSFSSLTIQSDLTVNRYGGDFGASALNTANPSLILNITNSLTVGSAATGTIIGNVNITVPTLTVNSGSQIKAYATGFHYVQGPGYKDTNSGGSYGGVGANNNSTSTYGSATAPTDLGSGSGDKFGGGAIRLNVSGTLTNSGTINANGETSGGGSSDGGAGGSIYITVGALAGTGTFTANGGVGTAGLYGGGGGRIALEVGANDSCPVYGTKATVTGGDSYSTNPDGSPGTYRCGPLSATLTSNSFNTGDSAVDLSQISWDETVVGGSATSTVRVLLRTAPNNAGVPGTWTDWMGPTGTSTVYFETVQSSYCSKVSTTVTCSVPNGIAIGNGASDQWIQYKIFLVSTDLSVNPIFSNVTLQYISNSPPQFNNSYGTNGVSSTQMVSSGDTNWGKVPISYSVRDTDTNTGSTTPNLVTPSFDYNIGAGWNAITSGYLGASDLSNKSVGISTYTVHSALWNAKGQISGNYTTNAQIRVNVNDNEAVNNTSSSISSAFTLDTKNPVVSSSTIDGYLGKVTLAVSDDTNLQYEIAAGALAGSWTSAGATSTTVSQSLSFSGTYPTANFATRDAYNNTTTVAAVAPSTPANIYIKDISNPDTETYKIFLAWDQYTASTSAAFERYQVFRSTDSGSTYSHLASITSVGSNSHTDTSLSSSTTYYYKIRTVDADWDISASSTAVSDKPDGQGGTDRTAPTITSVTATSVQATWAKITWTTDELATSQTGHSLSPSTAFGTTNTSNAYATSHSVTITGLTPNTAYLYRVRSTDPSGNIATSDNGGAGHSFTTAGGATISSVSTESVRDNVANIIWNTDKSSDSFVVYATAAATLSSGGGGSAGSSTLVTASSSGIYQHRVAVTGLSANTKYYYYVKSTDAQSNLATDTNGNNYYTFSTSRDTNPPVISSVSVAISTRNSAVITWLTDEAATSKVEYGTTSGSYPNSTTIDTSLTNAHSVTMTGLTASTTYYYRVRSMDGQNNEAVSAQSSFNTPESNQIIIQEFIGGGGGTVGDRDSTAPRISNIKVLNITAFGATISFDTDEQAVGSVAFGKDASYTDSEASPSFKTSHSIKLSRLQFGQTYHFQARARDKAGNFASSEDKSFVTLFAAESLQDLQQIEDPALFQENIENLIESVLPSLVPPFVSSIEVVETNENSTKIKWKTNVPSFGALSYSSQTDYGDQKPNPYATEISESDKKSRDHKVILTNLSPKTTYHFQAKAYVLPGVIGKSKDQTFVTLASKIKPEIARLGNTEVEVRWITDEETSSFLEYKDISSGKGGQSGDQAKVKTHSVRLENLAPDANYQIRAFGYDKDNNLIEGDPLRIKTTRDSSPPSISNVKIDSALLPGRADRLQTVVSWKTDEPSNSIVKYDEGISIGGNLTKEAGQANEAVTEHFVIITQFKPSTVYRVKIVSQDTVKNTGETSIRTILTPVSSESVLDIVTKNLEESFGFLKKLQF